MYVHCRRRAEWRQKSEECMTYRRVVNVASVPHRSPFRYPGGKTWLVPYVRRWFGASESAGLQLAEPFAGGAIVGLSALFEGLCDRISLVEMDDDVAAVWRTILNGQAARLARLIVTFEVSRPAVERVLRRRPRSDLSRAFATIVKNRMQRGGIIAPGASLMKNGENGKGLKSRWYPDTLKTRILAIAERRDQICFTQGDALEYIRDHRRSEGIAYFIDPPYTIAGRRLYRHSQIDHSELFRLLSQVQGDFLMTYDDAEPIRALARKFGFDTELVAMKNTHHNVMTELLIGRNLDWLHTGTDIADRQQTLFAATETAVHA